MVCLRCRNNQSVHILTVFCRFISPRIGSLSDKYGRKRILLITMIGNILSALVYVSALSCLPHTVLIYSILYMCRWIKSTTFATYLLSRVIGGLSEGNVQLAMYVVLLAHLHLGTQLAL